MHDLEIQKNKFESQGEAISISHEAVSYGPTKFHANQIYDGMKFYMAWENNFIRSMYSSFSRIFPISFKEI